MQQCKRCGLRLSDNLRVCPYCGYPVEPEDEKRRKRLMLRWQLSALLAMKRSTRNLLFSPTQAAGRQSAVTIAVFFLSLFTLLAVAAVGFSGRQQSIGPMTPTPSSPPFPPPLSVSPTILDFGELEVGRKAVLAEIVQDSSVPQPRLKPVSGNAQWLSITLRTETKEANGLWEIIYDVTANTSKLHVGQHSVMLSIGSDGGRAKPVNVKIQVIPQGQHPPAKLHVNPLVLDFGAQNVGNQKTLLLTVSNSGEKELSWAVGKGKTAWLTLDTSSGKIPSGGLPQVIKVEVDTTGLTAGPHSAAINFNSNGGNISVNIKLLVVSRTLVGKRATVVGIDRRSGPTSGGTSVTITGTGFSGATSVAFGSTTTSNFTVLSDTQITVVSPPGNPGTVDVTVTTPAGTSAPSAADLFTYVPPVSGECAQEATIASLKACVQLDADQGFIDNQGVTNSLLAKLDTAQAALDRGQTSVAINTLMAFIHEVQAQAGKHIESIHAQQLVIHAQLVIQALEKR
jgi:hypothetical protein